MTTKEELAIENCGDQGVTKWSSKMRKFSQNQNFPKIWFLKIKNMKKFQKLWIFFENLKFSLKYDTISEKFTNFQKSEKFPKIWTISENLKKILKIWKISENLKIFRKSEKLLKI